MSTPSNDLNITQAGYVVFDGISTFTGRTFQAGTGITLSNASGVAGNTTISLTGGGSAVEHLTGDSGGQLNPDGSNNFNIIGQQAGTVAVMDTIGASSTISIENHTWLTQLVVDASSTVGLRGTFTTIQSAITAAVSGQNIFIRPGTYTENLTLKAGVNLVAFKTDQTLPSVTIVGTCTFTGAGSVGICNIRLQTNSAFLLAVTGNSASIVQLFNCYLNCSNNTGISFTSSNSSSGIALKYCEGDIGTTGITLFAMTSTGTFNSFYSFFSNSGGSSTASTSSNGMMFLKFSSFLVPITNSASNVMLIEYSEIDTSAVNATSLTYGGTAGSAVLCRFTSGSASSVSIGSSLILSESIIISSNTNAVTGAGSVSYGALSFGGSSSLMNVTTQVPLVHSNDAVRVTTPGAYPYTTVPQDNLILVDSSSARTIVPLASPTTGQVHRIKDNVGSAAANNITITPSGKNIDGVASYVISSNYGSVDIIFNGTQWNVL